MSALRPATVRILLCFGALVPVAMAAVLMLGAYELGIVGLAHRACRAGSSTGCAVRGLSLQPSDPAEARRLLSFACEAGSNAAACWKVWHANSRDLAGLNAMLVMCFRGRPIFCGAAGLAFRSGGVVPRDDARALALYRRGCLIGKYPWDCWTAVSYIEAAEPPPLKNAAGRQFLREACDRGVNDACRAADER